MEDGWHGGSTATTSSAPTVDDRLNASDMIGIYGELADALKEALRDNPTAATAAKGEATKSGIESGKGVVSPALPDDAAAAFGDLDPEQLKTLLDSLISRQNEVNTITQVISTSEKIYGTGKENYEKAEKKIPEAEQGIVDSKKAWEEAKGWMTELEKYKAALDAAETRLLNAETEEERQRYQAELDAARKEWQEYLAKVLDHSEKEIEAARKLGDKALEKEWTECHDHLKDDGQKINSSLDNLSENMKKYFTELDANGKKNEDYLTAAKVNDQIYQEASADFDYALKKMKELQSAMVMWAMKVLEEAQRLLADASGDLNMSLDQARKALDMALKARSVAEELYEQAKGTPYEEQAKQLLDTATSVAARAQASVDKIQDYLHKKGIGEQMTDDEYADKRLKEAEEYLRALGYKSVVEWNNDKGDSVNSSIEKLRSKNLKDDTWYKIVGRKGDGTLFLADDVRFYTVEMKDQVVYDKDESFSYTHLVSDPGAYADAQVVYAGVVNVKRLADATYLILEINGDVFLQSVWYDNPRVSKNVLSFHEADRWGCGPGYPGAPSTPSFNSSRAMSLVSNGVSPTPADSFPFWTKTKVFSKDMIGF